MFEFAGDWEKPINYLFLIVTGFIAVHGIRYRDDGRTMVDGIRRVSTPGRRVYVGAAEIPKVRNGLGMAILSTPRGVMCDRDAREAKVGGEVICEVW